MAADDHIKNQTAFQRLLYNERAQGAYFTDIEHAKLIANFFEFPEDEEVCSLDPSIGDGAALALVTGKEINKKVKTFGVEVNKDRYLETKSNPLIDYVIQADFTQDVRITNHSFTFCYLNPPYMNSIVGERYEKIFFRKVDNYLKPGAILCMVIPYYILEQDEGFIKMLTNRYDTATILKFREPEFSRFKQIVIVAVKKAGNVPNPQLAKDVYNYVSNIETAVEIPLNVSKKLKVPPSNPDEIITFEGEYVDVEDLRMLPSASKIPDYFIRQTTVAETFTPLKRPPIMPGRDHLYLLTVIGFGKGKLGNEEKRDIHLQRGTIIQGNDTETEETEDGRVYMKVRHYKKAMFTVLEQSGKITKLQ